MPDRRYSMFLGTTTAPFRNFLADAFRELRITRYVEPCAGNFVMAQIVSGLFPQARIITGDINEYSVLIGSALAGEKYPAKPTALLREEFPAMARLRKPEAIGAAAMLLAEAGVAYKKSSIPYYGRVYRQTRDRAEELHARLTVKILALKSFLGPFSFSAQDAAETIKGVHKGDVVFYDPPYMTGSYDAMFEAMRLWYDYPEIAFTELTEAQIERHLKAMDDAEATVFYRTIQERRLAGYHQVFRYNEIATAQADSLVYSNTRIHTRLSRRKALSYGEGNIEILSEDSVLGKRSHLEIKKIDNGVANRYRLLWTRKIMPTAAENSYAVMVDNKMAGIIAIAGTDNHKTKSGYILIVSDVTNPATAYRRLSKLVLCAALTEEFLKEINDGYIFENEGFVTAVYTDKLASMKYRGLMKKTRTGEGKGPGQKVLIYRCDKPKFRNTKEAYHYWFEKHGEDLWTED